jgi:hypothetical protein
VKVPEWPSFMNRHHAIRSQWGPIAFLRLRDRKDFTVGGISSILAAVLVTFAIQKWSLGFSLAALPFTCLAAIFWKDHFEQIAELRSDVIRIANEDESREASPKEAQ